MENRRDNSDALWDAVLGELGRRERLSPSPSVRQTTCWAETIASSAGKTAPRRSHAVKWRVWGTYVAAAAVLVMAGLVGIFVNRNSLTADEVFYSVDNTITASQVVKFSVCGLQMQKHVINMDFMCSNTDENAYVGLNIRPLSGHVGKDAVSADIVYISQNSTGLLLVKKLSVGGVDVLADMNQCDSGSSREIAIRFDDISGSSATRRFITGRIELKNIQELINSLKNSASDFQITRIDGNRSEMTGVIDKPQNISIKALMQAAMMASYANMLVLDAGIEASNSAMTPAAKKNFIAVSHILMETRLRALLRIMPRQVDRLFRFVALCQLYSNGSMDDNADFIKYRTRIDSILNAMRVTLVYDRSSNLIRRVTLKKSDGASVNIRFATNDELKFMMSQVVNESKKIDGGH
ncbi:MAG TPA: hypothetical protein PLK08_02420 [Phycisphaerae bacterium]|nr:hypothetical protein [Phycisphaerae bacterium]